jgi:hypothetical protein
MVKLPSDSFSQKTVLFFKEKFCLSYAATALLNLTDVSDFGF